MTFTKHISFSSAISMAFCWFAATPELSKADQAGINAHTWTAPAGKTTVYYWIRIQDDTVWGVNGFEYVASGNNTYYVLPYDISWPTADHVVMSADVQFGPKKIPAVLKAELWSYLNGTSYASYSVTSVANPQQVLDQSPRSETTSGYVRMYIPKSFLQSSNKSKTK